MSSVQKGSQREVISEIFKKLADDDILLRLLYYLPEDYEDNDEELHIHPPLSDLNPPIKDTPLHTPVVEESIRTSTKSTDIEEKAICRLYIYAGRRRAVFNNYLLATQEIVIDIFVHESFDKDMRLSWISDRINELIALECVKGSIGKLDYVAGNSRMAPIGYSKYENIYEYTTDKK